MKIIQIICPLVVFLVTIFTYRALRLYQLKYSENLSEAVTVTKDQRQNINPSSKDRLMDGLSFTRRTDCNYERNEMCYSTNKTLVVTFWQEKSGQHWVSQNILSAFPLHSFDHIVFVHDNSTWNTHPGYEHFVWIHVYGQLRLWYVKRFITPTIVKAYKYLWIIDDDAHLTFAPLHYQCVVQNLSIPLSAPARLNGSVSHGITLLDTNFKNQIGRWTDFVETGPVIFASSLSWQCIYMYLDASAGSGWGIDLVWCNLIAQRCFPEFERTKACAILDAFIVHHQSASTNSINYGAPELSLYTVPYKAWHAKLQNFGSLAKDTSLIDFCSK